MKFLQKLMQSAAAKQGQQPAPATNPDQGNQQQQPNQQQTTQQTQTFENPLDFYGQLSQNKQQSTKTAPEFAIPKDTINKAASSLDFASSIPQDIMAKLQAGDMSAFAEALNHVGRQAYAVAIEHNSALTNKFVGDRLAYEGENFDQRIQSRLVTSSAKSIQSLHPQAQAMFRDNMERLRQQFPDATVEDLEGATWEVMETLGKQFVRQDPAQQQQMQQQKNLEIDYDQLAGYSPADGGAGPTQ